ncbi:methanogenesis marker protein Mmp4/MtxX [Methanococcus maripaludis]|mgnify:CR=1 FL=1|uniref:Basic helix-loop-helix dimerization domain bHLH n=1 Tax=Methanococcus maripaludis (strain DSM 14266 / JCM 13030 / NBRC 101832 / S2 / LL) TaxID=267377 RepID=Q6LXK4_METMP|nr:methanogenesis marker protein Mmp4/MtxX [Methanococcus maripaludis]CAF30902.1 Basic helix-loop-helix dimerization domain bHLH [Methanococcus maripaludis S2]
MYAIGISKNRDEVLIAAENLKKEGIKVELVEDPEILIDGLLNKRYEGAVRGSLSSSKLIPILRKKIGKFYRASILKNPFNNEIFILAPVGIDEISESPEIRFNEKLQIIKYSSEFLKSMEMIPKVGILSAGRLSDVGRSKKIDDSIMDAEKLLKYVKSSKYKDLEIEHKGILVEEYLKEGCNIILADDGISGNLLFRSFALVCDMEGFGAIILNSENIKYIDTSRSGSWKRYYNAVKFLKEGF